AAAAGARRRRWACRDAAGPRRRCRGPAGALVVGGRARPPGSEGLEARVGGRRLAEVDVDEVVVALVGVAVVDRVVAGVDVGVEAVGGVVAVVHRGVGVVAVGVEAVGGVVAVVHRVVGHAGLVAVVGDLDGAVVAVDVDVLGLGRGGGAVTEGDAGALGGVDVDVVGLHGAVAHDRLVEGGVGDLGEVAVAEVGVDVALAADELGAVAHVGVLGGHVGGVAVTEAGGPDDGVVDDWVAVAHDRVVDVAGDRAAHVAGGDGRVVDVAAGLHGPVAGVD